MKEAVCTKCGETKPLTAEFFHRDKTKPTGFRCICKECRSREAKSYYIENISKFKQYYQANKERFIQEITYYLAVLVATPVKKDKDFHEWYPKQEFYSPIREEKILNYLNMCKEVDKTCLV